MACNNFNCLAITSYSARWQLLHNNSLTVCCSPLFIKNISTPIAKNAHIVMLQCQPNWSSLLIIFDSELKNNTTEVPLNSLETPCQILTAKTTFFLGSLSVSVTPKFNFLAYIILWCQRTLITTFVMSTNTRCHFWNFRCSRDYVITDTAILVSDAFE